MALAVRGLRELNQTFKHAPKDIRKEKNDLYRRVGEPVRASAEGLAVSSISRMTVPWSRMRVGITQTLIYVAPRKRGVKGRGAGGARRPRFGDLMMTRALEPALERNRGRIEGDFDRMLGDLVHDWDNDGP